MPLQTGGGGRSLQQFELARFSMAIFKERFYAKFLTVVSFMISLYCFLSES
jgi:hypothetical protein